MSIETGRKIVDYLLDLYEQNTSDFINRRTKAVVLDFIGGEPLLEAALIEKICDRVGVIIGGKMAADGTLQEVCAGQSLEDRFFAIYAQTVGEEA